MPPLVLGSATPSVESYEKARTGDYRLYTLTERAKQSSRLAGFRVVDLREELRFGNKSIFSGLLQELMERPDKKRPADDAVFKPEGIFEFHILPFLRRGSKMSSL